MPCFHPLDAYQSIHCDPDTGKRSITFNSFRARDHVPIKLPCGQCVGCRLERSRQWAVRCIHEAQMHSQNCFITLTFSPEALARRKNPASVDVRDFQLFMKGFGKSMGRGFASIVANTVLFVKIVINQNHIMIAAIGYLGQVALITTPACLVSILQIKLFGMSRMVFLYIFPKVFRNYGLSASQRLAR